MTLYKEIECSGSTQEDMDRASCGITNGTRNGGEGRPDSTFWPRLII